MKIDYPAQEQIPKLRRLWKEAFSDDDGFLDAFFSKAFAPDRCRCVTVEGEPAAALYWFDCQLEGQPVAYIYAVATAEAFRNRGLCRALMENAHSHLAYLGYAGAVLVPGSRSLFQMYEAFGYRTCSMITEFVSAAAEAPVEFRKIDAEEFCGLRRKYLPAGSVLQEGVSLEFLKTMASFYAGADFLLTVSEKNGRFFAPELLGNVHAAPSILTAFGKKEGTFRTVGGDKPFAMYRPFGQLPPPRYFGFAFD
jgi:hypothetical protein